MEIVNNAYQKSLQNQEPYSIEHRLLMSDGRIKYVEEKCKNYFNTIVDQDPKNTPEFKEEIEGVYSTMHSLFRNYRSKYEEISKFTSAASGIHEIESSAYSTIENFSKFAHQMTNPLEQYEKDSGVYDKGDYKMEKRIRELIPILSKIEIVKSTGEITIKNKNVDTM